MKTPDPDQKPRLEMTAKEQPFLTTKVHPALVGKSKPHGDVQSVVDGGIPQGLVCIRLTRFTCPRKRHGSSEERQEQLIRQTASRFNWSIAEDLKVETLGVSGFHTNPRAGNPYGMNADAALRAFVSAADSGTLDLRKKVIILDDVSRFTSASIDWADSPLWALVTKGLSFYFVADGLFVGPEDKNNPVKRMLLSFVIRKAQTVAAMRRRISLKT
jgi:hypothetical protein